MGIVRWSFWGRRGGGGIEMGRWRRLGEVVGDGSEGLREDLMDW